MIPILPTLRSVISNVLMNRDQIKATITANEARGIAVSPDVQDAIDLLVKTFDGDAQKIGELIVTQLQTKRLRTAHEEIEALVASIQLVMSKDDLLKQAHETKIANAETNSPLLDAAGTGGVSAAGAAANEEPAAAPQEAGPASVLGA